MSGKLAWGYYPTDKIWLPIQVDSAGRIKVDMSSINLDDLADVDLTGLADDDFMYYDLASGLWKPRKLADADIPATIARDTEVTAAVTAHAALATGIHGVGSYYICLAPAAAHLVRSFTKGWTSGKLLKGAGVDANPTEISGWQVVTEVIVSSNSDYIDLTSLDVNTDKFYLLFLSILNNATSLAEYSAYVQADYTATNYYRQYLRADNATISAGRTNNAGCFAAAVSKSVLGIAIITRDIAGIFRLYNLTTRNDAASMLIDNFVVAKVATVTNITSLRIQSTVANGIGVGSLLILCKPRSG